MNIIQEPILNAEDLNKLNERIKKIMEEDNHIIDTDILEIIYGFIVRRKKRLYEGNIEGAVKIKRAEMIKIVLNFFKSIDYKLYEKAKNVILNIDERANINIVNVNNDDSKRRNGYVYTNMGKSEVYIPTQSKIPKILSKDNEMCSIADIFTLTHEISHLFDLNPEFSLPHRDYLLGEKEKYYDNRTRKMFSESIAMSFETLLTEYLMKETSYSKYAIRREYNMTTNYFFELMSIGYTSILLAKETKQSGDITQDSLKKFIENNGISVNYFRYIVHKLFRDPRSLEDMNKYIIAIAISPTIVKKFKDGGFEELDKYLEAIKSDNIETVLSLLGISFENLDWLNEILHNSNEQDNIINHTLYIQEQDKNER